MRSKIVIFLGIIILFGIIILTSGVYSQLSEENEKYLCNKIYYLLLEKGDEYTMKDIGILTSEVYYKLNISQSEVQDYTDNYWNKCYLTGISDKPPREKEGVLTIPLNEEKINLCETEFDNQFLDSFIPFPDVYIGNSISCKKINFLKIFLGVEERGKEYYFLGIRIWIFMVLGFLIVFKLLKDIRDSQSKLSKIHPKK